MLLSAAAPCCWLVGQAARARKALLACWMGCPLFALEVAACCRRRAYSLPSSCNQQGQGAKATSSKVLKQHGEYALEMSLGWTFFFFFLKIHEKTKVNRKALRLYIVYNSYDHCPCTRLSHVPRSAFRLNFRVLKNRSLRMFRLRMKSLMLSVQDCHWQNSWELEKLTESTAR